MIAAMVKATLFRDAGKPVGRPLTNVENPVLCNGFPAKEHKAAQRRLKTAAFEAR